ncbi:hypothetical protein BDZ45DRAFT_676616 [Acephala macrosclerotiorum]|nr:hypothetical protein BDZ45DRAFT_676616 [Acephala macrosclerotiorum]
MPRKPNSVSLQTAYSLLNTYSTLSAEALIHHFDDECTHQVLPSSIEMPARDKESFASHASQITSIFSAFSMVPQSVLEDPTSNTVIVHARMIGKLVWGEPWENECIMLLKMSEDGTKIVEIKEFVDSWKFKLLQEKSVTSGKGNMMKDGGNGDRK